MVLLHFSFAGLVNRKNAGKATKICVAYDGMERFFPKEKIVFTGNPIRKDITPATAELKAEGYNFYNLNPDKKTVFILGGSLGCRTLNEWMKDELTNGNLFGENSKGYQVIWQCGNYYKNEVTTFMKNASTKGKGAANAGESSNGIFWSDFIKRMDLAYSIADVIISRAGAGTISELCEAGKCTIFVPSPIVAEDHQTHNAMALVQKNAARLVKDSNARKELSNVVSSLLINDAEIAKYERNITQLAKKDAAKQIAEICLSLINE